MGALKVIIVDSLIELSDKLFCIDKYRLLEIASSTPQGGVS